MNRNLGINIAGYVSGEFGIGEGVRANIRSVEAAGIPFAINNFTRSPHRHEDTSYDNFHRKDNPYPVNLIQVNADQVKPFLKYAGANYLQNRYNIGFWAWELPQFPPKWQPAFDCFHEIWTYSNFCAEAIALASPIPAIKIMPSISLPAPSLRREALELPENKFIFLFVFDFCSRIERKNPLAVIEAFKQAFGGEDRAVLVLKSSNADKFPEHERLLESAMVGCDNIKHINGYLSREKLNALIYNCDCYISLHRCEGFGLTMAEAMFYGKPVIATAYSSNTEFMNVGNSFLVKYKLTEIPANCGPYKQGNIWADPDPEHAADLMRYVFDNRDRSQQIGAIAAKDIQTLLNPQVAGCKIRQRLEYVAKITDNFQNIIQPGSTKVQSTKISKSLLSIPEKKQQPLVSICIPTYNGEAFIAEAIQSAIDQTYPNIEIIVSDDGSADRTVAIAQSFLSQTTIDFRTVLHRNYGLSQNWNFCISQAKGEYIKFLFQDDFLAPDCIEKMVQLARQDPEIGMVFSPRGIAIAETESHPILRKASQAIKDLYKGWSNLKQIQHGQDLLADAKCLNNPINKIGEPTTVLIAARVFQEIGLFDSELSQYVDLDMWWRILGNYKIGFVSEQLSALRIHPEQQTWKNFAVKENHKDIVRFYKKILNNPEYNFLSQEFKQQIRQKLVLKFKHILPECSDIVELYKQSPSDGAILASLRQARRQLAETWLNLPADKLENAYSTSPGENHQILLDSGIKNETLTEEETTFVGELASKLAAGGEIANNIQPLLAAMLYADAYQLPLEYKNAAIPQWLFDGFLKFLFQPPTCFQQIGEVAKYSEYLQQLIDYVATNIAQFPDSQVWQYLAEFIAKNANFQSLYLSEANLLQVLTQKADIIEFYLKNTGSPIDWTFDSITVDRPKINLGILLDEIADSPETFAALPIFEHLDRDKFEIAVLAGKILEERLKKYCACRADRLIELPPDLAGRVRDIRSRDLDILLICSNPALPPLDLLAAHRLARVQIAIAPSIPATTGIRNIDYFIAGNLALPANAAANYREKLIALEGSGICYSYPTELGHSTVDPTRQSWGATDRSVVFMSGARAFQIIPELQETWAKIIATVPNSILVLYPFRSRQEDYPVQPFFNQIRSAFAKSGIDKNRAVMIRALPSRADCIKCLKLADIYLDSYPYSSGCSIAEPLLLGLPTVARAGQTERSRFAAAILQELQLPELVANSENSYVEIGAALGTNPEMRQIYRDRIQQQMTANPRFLDSRACSDRIGKLFARNP
ncbi:MAG: glycosyltransferase [Oscillatoriaceae cyanobacterium Prado104]|jgi:predicted O-linked N-acetylglucosamine transferase (SPINDLY family)/GT2 family glycosyltransferase/glycosyltransferase involved in cell wall biosynthesis|nr:glycosyltransferase [Oscillatoriaceae cyanobacterium Prado104]